MYDFVFCSEMLHHTSVTTTMMYKCVLCLWQAVSFFYPPVLDRVVSVVLYSEDVPLNQAQDGAERVTLTDNVPGQYLFPLSAYYGN